MRVERDLTITSNTSLIKVQSGSEYRKITRMRIARVRGERGGEGNKSRVVVPALDLDPSSSSRVAGLQFTQASPMTLGLGFLGLVARGAVVMRWSSLTCGSALSGLLKHRKKAIYRSRYCMPVLNNHPDQLPLLR